MPLTHMRMLTREVDALHVLGGTRDVLEPQPQEHVESGNGRGRRAAGMTTRRVLVSTIAALALCACPLPARAQALLVDWSNQRLTVSGTNVPLATVLTEVARRTGSTIVGLERASRPVTVDIRNARLLDALRAILADVDLNYIYIPRISTAPSYDRLTLWLYGSSHAVPGEQPCTGGRAESCGSVVTFDGAEQPFLSAGPGASESEEAQLVADGHFDIKATEGGLLSLAKAPNYGVRVRALQALALQNSPAGHAAMTAALDDEHPFVRAEAIELLLHVGTPGGTGGLQRGDLLEHRDPEVRFSAVAALSEERTEGAELQLERALGDEDAGVRTIAADVLRQKARERGRRR